MESLAQTIDESIAGERYRMRLIVGFGLIALLLSAIGVAAVMSYSVSQRTREMAVRMAVGAGRGEILAMVLREGVVLAAAGLAVGLVLARLAAHAISTMLFDIAPGNPIAYGSAGFVLLTAVLLACLLPARRAARLDPVVVLKQVF